MRLLLDTHIWLWSVLQPDRLTQKVTEALESPDTALWLSLISVWELMVLVDKKRVALDRPPSRWISDVCTAIGLQDAPLTRDIAMESRRIALSHQDPADRFIAATAKVYGFQLVTADEHLLSVKGLRVLANR